MTTSRLQELLQERKIYRTGELTSRGVASRTILRAIERGDLVRPVMVTAKGPVPGILASPDADMDDWKDDAIAMLLTGGVLGRQYAAMRHGLCTAVEPGIQVIVPYEVAQVSDKTTIRITRTRREENLSVGIDTIETTVGVPVRITSPERTILDLLRTRNLPGGDEDYRHGIAALTTYVENGGHTGPLLEMAKSFEKWLPDVVEVACSAAMESYGRGYGQ